MQVKQDEQQDQALLDQIPVSVEPSFTISASNKFAPILVRMFADMMLNLGDQADDDFLDRCELSNAMDTWRSENPDKCVP